MDVNSLSTASPSFRCWRRPYVPWRHNERVERFVVTICLSIIDLTGYIASPSGFGGWSCNNTSSSSVNPPQRSGHAGSPHCFWLFEGIRFVRPIEEEAKT